MVPVLAFCGGLLLSCAASFCILNRWSVKYRGKSLIGSYRIPTVQLPEVDPVFTPDALGTPRSTEVRMIGGTATGGTSALEGWILAVLAKTAKRMFEFGTCTGKTTYAWAMNSRDEAQITTITLSAEDHALYQSGHGDAAQDHKHALAESSFDRFYYSGAGVEHKVEQLYGDSKQLDDSSRREAYDLIFVDGSHAYSYVTSDTEKAISMLAPGGLVLWHDYGDPRVRGRLPSTQRPGGRPTAEADRQYVASHVSQTGRLASDGASVCKSFFDQSFNRDAEGSAGVRHAH